MKSYMALIRINLKLALREKAVLFFNYIFPLVFFFGFGQAVGGQSGGMTQVVAMVLVLGILGSGLFGAGIRAVAEREANILRRYKVAPISPAPLLVASIVTGWVLFLPSVIGIVALASLYYGMPFPDRWLSLFVIVSLGAFALRAIGLIIASVVNSVAESNILIQLLYMPMLFLSGATFPLTGLPTWAQILSQFLPAAYVYQGIQSIMLRHETLVENAIPAAALVVATLVGVFISIKIFRWEKEEKIGRSAKVWLLVVFIPFLLLGGWQAFSRENVTRSKIYDREVRRTRAHLIRGARIFAGDGKVIENGAVLVKNGRIDEIYEGQFPEPEKIKADAIDAYGKTLLPGLIDVHVHLGNPGGIPVKPEEYDARTLLDRNLAAYLYSGVTAVKSVGDSLDDVLAARERIRSGERLGAELFVCGPLFTAEGGHGTEYFKQAPAFIRQRILEQFVRTPKNPAEAAEQVMALKARGVDGIKAVLEGGFAGHLFNRMDVAVFNAIAHTARQHNLPVVAHTATAEDVADAVIAHVDSVEHGVTRGAAPDDLLARLSRSKIAYSPTLSVLEAHSHFSQGKSELLDRTLVAQAGPNELIQNTKAKMNSAEVRKWRESIASYPVELAQAQQNLFQAWKAGVPLVTGTDSGNMLLLHGPAIHREMQLWVQAGIPPHVALTAATSGAARLLRVDDRIGYIRKGYEATLVLVDGNPLQDIAATERISNVIFKGERINRTGLFDQK